MELKLIRHLLQHLFFQSGVLEFGDVSTNAETLWKTFSK